jgi:hypothetical protein
LHAAVEEVYPVCRMPVSHLRRRARFGAGKVQFAFCSVSRLSAICWRKSMQ